MEIKLLSSLFASLCLTLNSYAEARLLTGDANNQIFNRDAFIQDISMDGKLVLFASGPPSSGAVPPGITEGGLYIRDLSANTVLFTGATEVAGEASLSDDGRYVSWVSLGNVIKWRDCQAGVTRLITPGANGASRNPIISADGRYVAYASVARNIVPDATKLPAAGRAAVYVYDSVTEETKIASLTYQLKGLSTGVGLNAPGVEFDFSANGQYIVFSTDAVDVHPTRGSAASQAYYWTYRRNLSRGGIEVVCKNASGNVPAGNFTTPRVDATGNRVLFQGSFVGLGGGATMVPGYNAPFASDFYMKDIATGEVWWISRTRDNSMPDGFFSGVGAINSNGTVVVFGSSGTKFVQENTDPGGGSSMDLFRVDIGAAGAVTTTLITKAVQGNANVDFFSGPYLPGTGEYVAFNAATLESLIGQGTDNAFFKHGVGVGAFPAAVVSSTPALSVSQSANQLTLSWPGASGFTPEFLTNLGQGGWTALSATPAVNNGVQSLKLPLEGKTKFFRLRRTAE